MASTDPHTVSKFYVIAEAVADRAEMHANIGQQRDNWNHLFLNSTNLITLTAAIMAGLSAAPTAAVAGEARLAFSISSTLLYLAATAVLLVVNKIQPSQLAEEQRNAARLLRHLHRQISTTISLRTPAPADVEEAMEKLLGIAKAYPLPLLPGMLEKFPEIVAPTIWWPSSQPRKASIQLLEIENNGLSKGVEEELKGVMRVIEEKDIAEFTRLSKLVLKINRVLAVSGPLLTGVAALGAAFTCLGSCASLVAVVCGALASVVNTVEHGGQVGMVFELYRNCAGHYLFLKDSIASRLIEGESERRESSEVFEIKLALQLGRSTPEMRDLARSSCKDDDAVLPGFAGKLF